MSLKSPHLLPKHLLNPATTAIKRMSSLSMEFISYPSDKQPMKNIKRERPLKKLQTKILPLTFNMSQSYFFYFTTSGARLPIGAKGTTDGLLMSKSYLLPMPVFLTLCLHQLLIVTNISYITKFTLCSLLAAETTHTRKHDLANNPVKEIISQLWTTKANNILQ